MQLLGIIHRDIKPENIIINPEEYFKICLADFGVSCWLGDQSEDMVNHLAGTPGYIEPIILKAYLAGKNILKLFADK